MLFCWVTSHVPQGSLKSTRTKPVLAPFSGAWQNVTVSLVSLCSNQQCNPHLTHHSWPLQICVCVCVCVPYQFPLASMAVPGCSLPRMEQKETELRGCKMNPLGISTLMIFYTVDELKTSSLIKCLI